MGRGEIFLLSVTPAHIFSPSHQPPLVLLAHSHALRFILVHNLRNPQVKPVEEFDQYLSVLLFSCQHLLHINQIYLLHGFFLILSFCCCKVSFSCCSLDIRVVFCIA